MLDEKDLQSIQSLMDKQKSDILEQSTANMRVLLESSIGPQLQLLAEGQNSLFAKLAPRSEVEELREEIDFLKSVVRAHEREIQELKKAQ